MKKIALYYFSGTGNTLHIAKQIQQSFTEHGYACELCSMEEPMTPFESCEYMGLLFPVAVQSTYPLVWRFVEALPEVTEQKVFMVDTMQGFSGGVVGPMKKLLQRKGYDCVAAKEIKMTNSMETNAEKKAVGQEKNKRALETAKDFVSDLLYGKGEWGRMPLFSDAMCAISKGRKIWTKLSENINTAHDLCVHCGLCLDQCPVNAISEEEGLLTINHDICECCMRCVTICPKHAVKFRGKDVVRFWNKT